MKLTVSILGCGWLGLPLGNHLSQRGFRVKGSVISKEMFPALEQAGISPSLLLLSPDLSGENTKSFFACDVLIVNFPPERRADIEEYLPSQIQSLIKHLHKNRVRKILFISSTSVYPDLNREVYEHEHLLPAKGSGKALKAVEDMLLDQKEFVTTVLRFGGLVGYDRLPGQYLTYRKDVSNADVPVNLIHRDDCIEIIYQIIRQDIWGEVFNACADEHPLRRDYYYHAALQEGLEPPVFSNHGPNTYKIVNSDKLKASLNYTFKYPDPTKMLMNGVTCVKELHLNTAQKGRNTCPPGTTTHSNRLDPALEKSGNSAFYQNSGNRVVTVRKSDKVKNETLIIATA